MERTPSDAWQRAIIVGKQVRPRVSFWNRADVKNAILCVVYLIILAVIALFVFFVADLPEPGAKFWHVGDYESAPNPADTWEYAP